MLDPKKLNPKDYAEYARESGRDTILITDETDPNTLIDDTPEGLLRAGGRLPASPPAPPPPELPGDGQKPKG